MSGTMCFLLLRGAATLPSTAAILCFDPRWQQDTCSTCCAPAHSQRDAMAKGQMWPQMEVKKLKKEVWSVHVV